MFQARPARTDQWSASSTAWYQPDVITLVFWLTPTLKPAPPWNPNFVSPSSKEIASCETLVRCAAAPAARKGWKRTAAVGIVHFRFAPMVQSLNVVSLRSEPCDHVQ